MIPIPTDLEKNQIAVIVIYRGDNENIEGLHYTHQLSGPFESSQRVFNSLVNQDTLKKFLVENNCY